MTITRVRKRQRESYIIHWKNLLKVVLFLMFLTVCFFTFDKLDIAHYFPIKEVKVFGVHHVDRQEMQNLLAPMVSKGFFGVDVDRIKERLQQSPWINHAYVKRVWPDVIAITLDEKTPLARWNKTGLLSTTGEIFSPDITTYPDEIPQFIGPEGEQIHMLQNFKRISGLVSALHFKVSRLELTPSMSWSLTLDNGMKISMGYKDILTHIGHFVKVYPKIIGTRVADVDYVDLRYPNGLAVRWKSS